MTRDEAHKLLREAVLLRHLSKNTLDCYAGWLERYLRWLKTARVEAETSERKLEGFLTMLAKQGVSASTQNQAFNALLFFYKSALGQQLSDVRALRAKRKGAVRHAPELETVRAMFAALEDLHGYPTRFAARLLYGCGLRVTEALSLRMKDVRLASSELVIRGSKGDDRTVAMPCELAAGFRAQLAMAKAVWRSRCAPMATCSSR